MKQRILDDSCLQNGLLNILITIETYWSKKKKKSPFHITQRQWTQSLKISDGDYNEINIGFMSTYITSLL